ncbi:DUF2804 domain-containing protein [Terricaulis sp.]|uniref:DUF2804 domain-containing protein n=1 Tax=Terricaulis sp. TaxID=2768686 RepID=UPI0037852927
MEGSQAAGVGLSQQRLPSGDLLDARGRLRARGYATREVCKYVRSAVKAWPLRTKEWDYYCVLTDRYGLALTVADNDYLGFLAVTWLDFEKRSFVSEEALLPFPLGGMDMPASADRGDVECSDAKLEIAYRHVDGGREISVSAPGFANGQGLSGKLFLEQPPMDRMTIATPFAGAPRSFYYNQKINCLRARGAVAVGTQSFAFEPDSAFGVLDWGRGAWTYDNTWYWASASGIAEGRVFGFNLGYGFGDTSAATENMLFVDGRAHKLSDVEFHMPPGAPDSAPWRFTGSDNRLDLKFTPILDRASRANIGIVESDQHQVFGRFNGYVVLDDGARLSVENLIGFAEKVRNRW